MKITFTEGVPPGSRYAAHAFDRQLGRFIHLTYDRKNYSGKIVACVVSPDGNLVEITIDVPELDLSDSEIENIGWYAGNHDAPIDAS